MQEPVTYFSRLDGDECWSLLADVRVGRLAWAAVDGLTVVPVNFLSDGRQIVFHTAPGTVLASLTQPTDVAFQVDQIDEETAVGWSVLVRGTTGPVEADSVSWLADDRTVGIAVTATSIDGRVLSGTVRSEEPHYD